MADDPVRSADTARGKRGIMRRGLVAWDMECPGCGSRWLDGAEEEWHGIPCEYKTLVRRHADPKDWQPAVSARSRRRLERDA